MPVSAVRNAHCCQYSSPTDNTGYVESTRPTSSPESRHNPRNQNETGTLCRSLQSASHECKDCSQEQPVDATDAIRYPSTNETSSDGAEVILQHHRRGSISWELLAILGDQICLRTMLMMPPCFVTLVTVPSGRPMPTSWTYLGLALTPPMTPCVGTFQHDSFVNAVVSVTYLIIALEEDGYEGEGLDDEAELFG